MTAPTLDDYRFDLPPELIAQTPSPVRTDARLMLVARGEGPRSHHRIADLPGLLRGDELVILNDTRVVPARLRGHKASGGRIELLAIGPAAEPRGQPGVGPEGTASRSSQGPCPGRGIERGSMPCRAFANAPREFIAMGRSSKGFAAGMPLVLDAGDTVLVTACLPDGLVRVRLPDSAPDLWRFLEGAGEIPLPPYIERKAGPTPDDRERYQTVFARAEGAVAAPTAGLHFTAELLGAVRARGCEVATVTLHVGLGTFMPVRAANLAEHVMHSERYIIPAATATAIAMARAAGRPVLAVGTTVVRALEAAAVAHPDGEVHPGEADTRIFIREPYPFRVVDQLMTNFHLPESTLLVMVAAFAGRANILGAYETAVAERYRFFSYGDGMLIR